MSAESYGRYELIKRLATGGMAQIYLAHSLEPQTSRQLLVVKRILPHLAENSDFVRMFLDEARIAARLNHRNIVQIFDLGAQDDSYFIAMEYIHGEDVRRVWKRAEAQRRPVPLSLTCRIIIEASAGLDYAHKKTDGSGRPLNIVHRDVSPHNLLVSFEGEVKVVDFGIAKAADQATVTRSGVLKGKYSYMSPEQAAGQPIDGRSDIFSLGVVLYELLTGKRLFKRPTDVQTLNAVAECNVPPPSAVSAAVPESLDDIVFRALSKDVDQRYAEARHLGEALAAFLQAEGLSGTSEELAAFLRELYAERLAQERRAGQLVIHTLDVSRPEEHERLTALLPEPKQARSRASSSRPMAPKGPPTRTEGEGDATSRDRPVPSASGPKRPTLPDRPRPVPLSSANEPFQSTETNYTTQRSAPASSSWGLITVGLGLAVLTLLLGLWLFGDTGR